MYIIMSDGTIETAESSMVGRSALAVLLTREDIRQVDFSSESQPNIIMADEKTLELMLANVTCRISPAEQDKVLSVVVDSLHKHRTKQPQGL